MKKIDYEKGFIGILIELYIHSNTLILVKHNLIMKNEYEGQSNLINH